MVHSPRRMITALPLTVRYALAACVCLARHEGTRMTSRAIAESTGIPPAFLAKVLRQLGKADLIEGERGHHGGYRLVRPPEEVVLADVVDAVDGGPAGSSVCAMGDRECNEKKPCAMHELWAVATAPVTQLASSVTLERLARISQTR